MSRGLDRCRRWRCVRLHHRPNQFSRGGRQIRRLEGRVRFHLCRAFFGHPALNIRSNPSVRQPALIGAMVQAAAAATCLQRCNPRDLSCDAGADRITSHLIVKPSPTKPIDQARFTGNHVVRRELIDKGAVAMQGGVSRSRTTVRDTWRKAVRDLAPHLRSLPGIRTCAIALTFIHGAINQQEETRTTHPRCGAVSHGSWRTTSWRRSAAWHTATGHAPASRAHRCPCAGPCDDPLETWHPDLTPTPLRATVPLLLERSLHPARLPGGALLDPARSRASADRGAHQLLDRLWNEERRRPHRQTREPALRAQGQSARRPLPSTAAAHTARGTPCLALCAAESPASRRAAGQARASNRTPTSTTRSSQFRPLVRRLEHRHRTTEPYRHL